MLGLWISLVLVNLVTVATFARCFTGPGELVLLLPICLLSHVVARIGRIVGRTSRAGGAAIWVVAILLVAWVPIAVFDWHSLWWGLPLGRSQHLLAAQFHAGWATFSNRVAPVAEIPALVMAAAWASGAVALAAEALDADAALPAIVALIPAFDIVVFTGTLGTSAGRAPELAALAAFAVAYLAGTARQAKGEQVVTARVEGSAAIPRSRRIGVSSVSAATNGSGLPIGRPPSGRSTAAGSGGPRAKWRGKGVAAIAAPGLVVVAALAAGLIGPLLPGAKSAALVAWHGGPNGGRHGGKGQALNHPIGAIVISNLVQVGEQEINNPAVPLFDEYGPEPTREVLATLDVFNGNQWLPGASRSSLQGAGSTVPTFSDGHSAPQLEQHPLPLDVTRQATTITQVISVVYSGGIGNQVPIPGEVVGVNGLRHVSISAGDGEVLAAGGGLSQGTTFTVRADLSPGTGVVGQELEPDETSAPAVDTSLPFPVPVDITYLANQWTQGASTPLAKALLIEQHLTDGQFHYALPKHVSSGSVNSPGSGYSELVNFLYKSKSGYCQQFASAFAVMARVEGLPTRIVVGLLPGARIPHKQGWQVTGTDVHAWPQVFFQGTGWVDFEPTPGTSAPIAAVTPTTLPVSNIKPGSKTKTTIAHNITPARRTDSGRPGFVPPTQPLSHKRSGGGAGVLDVIFGLLAAAALWALGVPAWRLIRLRRAERDPVRGVLAEWGASVRLLAAAGFHRRRAETFDEYARRVRVSGLLSAPANAALGRLVQATNRAVFGKTPPSPDDMKVVATDASVVRRSVRKNLRWWQQILIQLDLSRSRTYELRVVGTRHSVHGGPDSARPAL